MARIYLFVALVSLIGLVSAEPSAVPSFFYPVEHRSDLQAVQDGTKVSLDGYDLQIIPSDQFDVAALDTTSLSITDIIWDLIPSPIGVLKAVCHKVWKIIKFTIPIDLILLGMALVVGFCAFTPYCTLIIEKPFALQLRSFRDSIPYMDEAETFFYQALDKFQELQQY